MWYVWGRGEVYTEFSWGNLKEGGHVEDLGVDRRIILKRIFEKWNGAMDWIDLGQNRDRWRAVVSAVMNFRFADGVMEGSCEYFE
jgi:hypothetical protein